MKLHKIIPILLMLTLCVYALLVYSDRKTPVHVTGEKKTVTTTPISETNAALYFSPSRIRLSQNLPKEMTVMLDAETRDISQVQLEIKYDPKIITVHTIRAADFFSDPVILLNEHDEKRGRIQFVIQTQDEQKKPNKNGRIATLSFTRNPEASMSGQTTFEFLPKTAVHSKTQTRPQLRSMKSAEIFYDALLPADAPPAL
jgi:hypothetical protein